MMLTFCVSLSSKVSDAAIELYSTTIAINQLIENVDEYIHENDALYGEGIRRKVEFVLQFSH
jgi:hypothetical protein